MTTEQLIKKASNNQDKYKKKYKTIDNKVAKTLHAIGIATIVLGIIGSFILSVNFDDDVPIVLFAGVFLSFITGKSFIGFSEVIVLLQKNVNQQSEIISIIKSKSYENHENTAPK